MIVKNAKRPGTFSRKHENDLGLEAHFNEKKLMNKQLLDVWRRCLDLNIGRTPGQNVQRNECCFIHTTQLSLVVLENVRVQFLSPISTAKNQMLDTEIITWIKGNYKCRLLLFVFENLARTRKSIYDEGELTASLWTECD